jgi:methyl-galactoside transport system permease protein
MKEKAASAAQPVNTILNKASLRTAVTLALAVIVVLSCLLPYIDYPVPAYVGYDGDQAYVDAQAEYLVAVQEYEDKISLRDTTDVQISDVLQPAVNTANAAYLEITAQSPDDTAKISEAEAALQTAKDELTAARKVLSGLQNLVGPVPAQNPVPASAKLIKYADGLADLAAGETPEPPMEVADVTLVDTPEEVIAAYHVTGFGIIAGRLSAANNLDVMWTLLPSIILIGSLAAFTLLKTPLKYRKMLAVVGVLLFCFSALRIETSSSKELGEIAKSYTFGFGYQLGIVASLLLLLNIALENKKANLSLKSIKHFASEKAIFLVLLGLIAVIALINPKFFSTSTFINIIQQSSTRLIIAMGMSFVIIGTGGVDLSACRVVGMAAVVSASMLQNADYSRLFYPNLPALPVILPFALAVLIALLFGLFNGFVVSKLHVPPFIATLATMVIVYGATSIYFNMEPNNSQPIGGLRSDFGFLGTGEIYGFIPIIVLIALAVCFIVWFLQNKTVFGKNVFAIGGNPEAAKVSGINVTFTVIVIFALCAALIGMAGVLEAARTGGATNNYGTGYELDAIAACVVGGVSTSGGVGTVGGVMSGVFIFQVINYGLTFIGVDPYWQQIIKGLIIAGAVALDIRKYMNKK